MESSLYAPVKTFLERQGYLVRAEVKHCDIAATRTDERGNEELLVVELKQGLTIDLLLQGVKRQKAADLVYLAVPRPKRFWFEAKWRDILHLLRRLELGLLLVLVEEPKKAPKPAGLLRAMMAVQTAPQPAGKPIPAVEVVLEPKAFDRAQSRVRAKKSRQAMLTEVRERSGDYNVGGSTGVPIVTVHRERALKIAAIIRDSKQKSLTIAELRKAGAHAGSASGILQNNVYKWFVRTGRGSYSLSPEGTAALTEFAMVLQNGSPV